jgi:hypothetical protein
MKRNIAACKEVLQDNVIDLLSPRPSCSLKELYIIHMIMLNKYAGKGANATNSYVHDFFNFHGAGETDAQINADNCGGQNKNNYVIWYYCWRVLCRLHDSILYSFLIAGHTKFSPDWCFGLVKQSFRRRYVSSLFDLMEAVDKSTVSGVNVAKLCGLHDGTVLVPVYDWAKFLETYFTKIPRISKFHHFRFYKDCPCVVFCKTLVGSPEIHYSEKP